MGLCHATLGTTCLSRQVYCLRRRFPGSLRIEMRCAKAKIRLQTEGGIRSTQTGKDAITTTDAGSKQTIEGKLGLCHRRPPETKGLVLTRLVSWASTKGGLDAEASVGC